MSYYVRQLYRFLDELGRRQDRQWFRENRAEYDELRQMWLADLDRVIAGIEPW